MCTFANVALHIINANILENLCIRHSDTPLRGCDSLSGSEEQADDYKTTLLRSIKHQTRATEFLISCKSFKMSTLLAIAALSSITPALAIFSGFDISNATLQLPPDQTQLTLPTNSTPTFVVLAVGVQNYTCSITSSWS